MSKKENIMIKRLKEIFNTEDLTDKHTSFYQFGGWKQSKRKQEFVIRAKQIAESRGIPIYLRDRDDIGVPLGQRFYEPLYISSTETLCEREDLQLVNNAAIQQMGDDIKRTVIIGLDLAHKILKERLGKEVTPETINHYMEVVNHTMPGGVVAQEHMAEVNPELTKDSYAKIVTGNQELKDSLDSRFILDIDQLFPEEKAEEINDEIGSRIFQVTRVPTIAIRIADGGIVHRWASQQTVLAFIAAYSIGGGAPLSDFAFAGKHAQVIVLGNTTWPRRARAPNEFGGIPFGYISDICQADRVSDPLTYVLESVALGGVLYDLIWWGGYMGGGVGPVNGTASLYTNEVLDELSRYMDEWIHHNYGGYNSVKPSLEVVKKIAQESVCRVLEEYDNYPVLLEEHWGGGIRLNVISTLASITTGLATGNSLASLMAGHYVYAHLVKEAMGRNAWGGGEAVDLVSIPDIVSTFPDGALIPELRGPNIFSTMVAHSAFPVGGITASHAAKGHPWVLSPVVKVAFSDPNLVFDFRYVRREIAKGAKREFNFTGDRNALRPGGE